MDCNETLREIYSYLDGELTMWKRRAIARHLDECPPCADGYTFEVELRQVIVSHCHEEVPESLRRRVAEALGEATGPSGNAAT
ncbi:MAG: mycothiol system anti-sigma-R factor [Acidimicrobiia bacterium]